MLKKLIKYEILADWKKYAFVTAALFIISFMLLVFGEISTTVANNKLIEYINMILLFAFLTLAVVAVAMLFVFATIRFYKSFIRDQGYLMHTLPVSTWQLIVSNLIAVYIWAILIAAVLMICGGISMGEPLWLFELIEDRGEVMDSIASEFGAEAAPELVRTLGIAAAMIVLSPAMYMTHIYFSFALGNLFSRNKLAMSVLMFFAVYFATQILYSIVAFPFFLNMMSLGDDVSEQQAFRISGDISLLSLIVSVITAIVFFIASERIFAKKLNLE